MKRQPLRSRAPSRLVAAPSAANTDIDLGPLHETLGYALRRAQLASYKCFGEMFAKAAVTPAQYSVLLVIDLNPGLRQNQISDALGIKRANFVGLIATLEKRGLVARHPAADGRAYALHLSDRGRKLLKPLQTLNAALEERLCAGLTREQRRTLMTALHAIADAV